MVGEVYTLGLGTGVHPGQTVKRVFSAVNWGAPIIEVDTPDWSQMGIQAIKELSKINKVDMTYHFSPGDPRNEFSLPDSFLIKASEGHASPESRDRNAQMNIEWAKQVGAKVIVVHPTSMLPRNYGQTVVFYDDINDSLITSQVPEHIWEKVERGEINEEKAREKYLEEIRKEVAAKIPAQMGQLDYNIHIYKDTAERLKKEAEQIKETMSSKERYAAALAAGLSKEDLNPKRVEELKTQAESFKYEAKHLEEQKELFQEQYARFLPPKFRPKEYKWKEELPSEDELKKQMVLNEEETTKELSQNFVRNFLPVAEDAIKSGIKVGIENMDSRFYFSHPRDMNILMDKLRTALKNKGYSDEQIRGHVGFTFDYGHANTMVDFKVKRKIEVFNPNTGKDEEKEMEVPYGAKDIKTPLDVAKKLNAPIVHAHYSENYGDTDAHLVAGTTAKEGEDRAKKIKELQEFFKSKGYEPRIIHEGGNQLPEQFAPIGYQIAFTATTPSYATVSGIPTSAAAGFGPSYLAALPFDPLIEKGKEGESFFFPSWMGDLF